MVVLALMPSSAHAVSVGAGRFDQMISTADVIVKVRVTEVEHGLSEMIAFSGEILSTLKTDGKPVSGWQSFEAPYPLWPSELGPKKLREGELLLLVLSRREGKLNITNNLGAILPASGQQLADTTNRSAEQNVFLELKSLLDKASNNFAVAKILVLLSHVALRDDLPTFSPYSKHHDPWIRRASYAAMARLDPQPSRVHSIVRDFDAHLKDTKKDHLFWDIYVDVAWASRCGSFGMEESLTSRARAYLPIYRTLLDKSPQDYQCLYIAIEGLKDVGTREDLLRLYRYRAHEKAWIRHNVLEGLGRILEKPVRRPRITSYEISLPTGVDVWERTTLTELEQVLKTQGVIRE